MNRSLLYLNLFSFGIIFLLYQNNRPANLFLRYPFEASVETKAGKVSIPFHAYAADVAIVYGTVSFDVASRLMKGQDYVPVQDRATGQGFGVIQLVTYNNTGVGPYKEIVIGWLAAKNPLQVDVTNEITPTALLSTHPEVVYYVWRLLLNQEAEVAIAYGREIYGLDKHTMKPGKWFDYHNVNNANWTYKEYEAKAVDSDKTLLHLKYDKEASPFTQAAYVPALVYAWGWKNIIGNTNKLFSNEFIHRAVSPKGILSTSPSVNPTYLLISHPSVDVGVTFWNPRHFSLTFGDAELAQLHFQPTLVQHDPWYQFVLLPPYNVGGPAFTSLSSSTSASSSS